MSTNNVTPIRAGSDDALPSAEIVARNRMLQLEPEPSTQDLREAIAQIDRMAQRGLGQIAAIAHFARKALQAKDVSPGSVRNVGRVLEAIAFLAEETMDSISIDAEAVGCNDTEAEAS